MPCGVCRLLHWQLHPFAPSTAINALGVSSFRGVRNCSDATLPSLFSHRLSWTNQIFGFGRVSSQLGCEVCKSTYPER